MTESTKPQGIFAKSGTRKRVRWFTALVTMGLVLTTGVVVADVILTYSLTNNVGNAGTSPFQWEQDSNYGAAAGLTLVSSTCATGSLTGGGCYALTATVSGVGGVATQSIDIFAFTDLGWAGGATFPVSSSDLTFSGGTALPAGDCAYVIVSNAALNPGDVALTSTPCAAGGITVTPSGAVNAPCGAATAGAAVYELDTGASVGGSYTCVASGTAGTALDVSYVIVNPTGATTTGATMDINAVGSG